ncbi:Glycosyltransferase [Melia azedarach]|uniref:Glycosyltransferase n=1 Tax=Melia azedarach TaxID=155640 RepID=A0ACC1Y3Q9_MELAZ|nr:Glycosyltransferase [Melia azedarach]
MIPMIDTARLLAQRGILVTIITTPMNAALFKAVLDRAVQGGLRSSYPSQFCNEKLVVQVLEIGVRIVAECSIPPKLADENGVLVKKEDVEKAINELMEEEEPESLRRC